MSKTRILYDNTDLTETYPDVREYLFDMYADERGWETMDDVPDDEISAEAEDINLRVSCAFIRISQRTLVSL